MITAPDPTTGRPSDHSVLDAMVTQTNMNTKTTSRNINYLLRLSLERERLATQTTTTLTQLLQRYVTKNY